MRGDLQLRQLDEDDDGTKVLYELCSMISQVLRTPPLHVSLPAVSSLPYPPAAFASLFLGVSVALMLFGSVTFAIGFFLMPVVIGLVMLFYFIGLLYNLSELFYGPATLPLLLRKSLAQFGDSCGCEEG